MKTHKTTYLNQTFIGLLFIGFCLSFNSLQAANIFVDQDATGNDDGSSWTNAYVDLQDALGSANSGDLIFVAEGVYKPTTSTSRYASFVIPSGVTLYGGFNGTETAINQRDLKNNTSTLSGNIGALGTNSDNSFQVVYLSNNAEASVLDGFKIQGGNSNDTSVSFDKGAAVIAINCSIEIRNCEIRNCEGISNLLHFGNGDYLLENVLMHNCTSEEALIGSGSGGSVFTFRNVTLAQNSSTNLAPMFDSYYVEANFYNSIIYNTAQFASPITGSWNPSFDHCLIGGGLSSIPEGTGSNIIDAIPQFTDVNGEDFTLLETSPAIDAGLDSHVQTDIDLCGNFRFSGESVDLGAFERSTIDYPIIYVDQDATGVDNGSSWTDAFNDLQDALAVCQSGDHIWVAEGTYKPTTGTDRDIKFILPELVSMIGGFAGYELDPYQRNFGANTTILSGNLGDLATNADNSYHVVLSGNGVTSTIDGFIIQGGNANGTGTDAWAGGIFLGNGEEVIIRNCLFQNLYATSGAVCHSNFCDIILENSYVVNCDSEFPVIHTGSSTTNSFVNNLIVNNSGEQTLQTGLNSTTTIEHCTFADNSCERIWGGNGEVYAYNSIFWETGPAIQAANSEFTNSIIDVDFTNYFNPLTLTNAFNFDPEFAAPLILNYRLNSASLAIDAGDLTWSTMNADIAGTPRPYNDLPDLGCYEAESCSQPFDFCVSAEEILLDTDLFYNSTRCATQGVYEPMACNLVPSKNVWYFFEGPLSGAVEIQLDLIHDYDGSADLRCAVYTGPCLPSLTEIACINNLGTGQSETEIVNGLVNGDNYWVRIEAGANEDALFSISINEVQSGTCPGDFDFNGSINSSDLLTLLSEFGCTSGCTVDMDENGEVNSADLLAFLAVFGTLCEL